MNAPPTALVIGSGFGGLAAAVRLRAKGYDVEILERHPDLGGRARVFHRNGFVFDAGPTVVTAPFLLEELFALHHKRLEDYIQIVPVEPWYRFRFHDNETFDYGGTLEDTLREIKRLSPEDQQGYVSLVKESKRIFDKGFSELAHLPFHQWSTMLRQVPALLRLKSYRSVYQMVSAHLKDERLRQAFSIQPLLVGGNPFTTTSIYSLIHFLERKWGIHFAMGGTGSIVNGFETLLREEGVRIRTEATVQRIQMMGNKVTGVTLAGGEEIQADLIVCNADPPTVYQKLLDKPQRRRWTDWRLRTLRYSMGLFVLYFGTTRKYPDIAHHTISMGPRYQGLLDDIFHKKHLAQDMSLYLHRPTATDTSMAPAGCDTFYVLSPVPNNQSGLNWEAVGPRYRDAVVAELERTLMPGLSECITEDFYITPDYFEHDLLTRHGTGFSVQPLFTQSAGFRFHNKSEEAEGLYFVGAGTHPGAGMPGVLSSAKVLEQLVPRVNDWKRSNGARSARAVRPEPQQARPQAVLAYHGKSFHWAGRLLPRHTFEDASLLYAFCRHVDDLADEATDPAQARAALQALQADLWSASPQQPLNAAFHPLTERTALQRPWVDDLIQGALSDLEPVRLQTRADLLRYAYQVAGTVGLMMARVLGSTDPRALSFAMDLGIGMQLTNISRDVLEDARNGRLYLPQSWLHAAGDVTPQQLVDGDPVARHHAEQAVIRLLDTAEAYYRSGYQGMRFLPTRVRFAIMTARALYRAIGDEIRVNPPVIWEQRVRVSNLRKAGLTGFTLLEFLFDSQTWPLGEPLQHQAELHQPLRRLPLG